MLQPLQTHVLFLEDLLQELSDAMTSRVQTALERDRVETQIQLITLALVHYRQGFEIEFVLRTGKAGDLEREYATPGTPQQSSKQPMPPHT